MNYFKCSVGGSGKGNTVIVTCAEEFAGQTIVLAKIGKRYTKTCPSTSPYEVRFYGVESGTYTVSATVQGQTYSETVVVQDVSCVLNYGFTWKTWVDTASQLDSTDYASLSEVLADEEAVRELFTEHACVDYMADSGSSNADLEAIIENDLCAKWINNSDYALDYLGANVVIKALMDTAGKYGYGEWVIVDDTTTPPTWAPKGNVPIMIANTAPYGEAIYSSQNSSYPAYQAFDGNDSTAFGPSSASVPQWIGYTSPTPICVKRVKIRPDANSTGSSVKDFIIQGSNDKSTWVDLYTGSLPNQTTATDHFIDVDGNDDYYLHHRVYITSKNGSWAGGTSVGSLQFYGRSLSVSVPTMTANTAPFGEASASTQYNTNYVPWKSFNGDETTITNNGWQSANPNTLNDYLQYEFTDKTRAVLAKVIFQYNSASDPRLKKYKITASNDGTNWDDVSEVVTAPTTSGLNTIITDLSATKGYKYYRLQNAETFSNTLFIITLQFYGLDYSEKEFKAGTTKKWLYDHGVELETLDVSRGIVTKNADSITLKVTSSSAASIGKNIDLTPYSLMRAKIGGFTEAYNYLVVSSSISSSTADASAQITSANSPYNPSLDVSAFNQTKAAFAQAQQVADATLELTEFWLE